MQVEPVDHLLSKSTPDSHSSQVLSKQIAAQTSGSVFSPGRITTGFSLFARLQKPTAHPADRASTPVVSLLPSRLEARLLNSGLSISSHFFCSGRAPLRSRQTPPPSSTSLYRPLPLSRLGGAYRPERGRKKRKLSVHHQCMNNNSLLHLPTHM